jgi:hypothetical protein
MPENENYTVELSKDEIQSLLECLANLRKYYAESYQSQIGKKASDNAVFIAASKLQHKLAHIVSPDVSIPLKDYLDYGN